MTTQAAHTNRDHASADFRAAMRNVTAAVSVVTTLSDGAPLGTTVSAFMSLSVDPPTLLVSLDNRSLLLSRLHLGSLAGVNLLAAHQELIALRFAQKLDSKFEGIAWTMENGAPRLRDNHAWLAITVVQLIEVGDHTLVIGAVDSAQAFPNAPLTYWRRTFGTHQVS